MAPNITSQTLLLSAEAEVDQSDQKRESSNYSSSDARFREILVEEQYKWKISWRNVIAFIYLHAISLYGLFLLLTGQVRLITFLWSEFSFLEPFDHRIQDSQGSFNFLFLFFIYFQMSLWPLSLLWEWRLELTGCGHTKLTKPNGSWDWFWPYFKRWRFR